MTDRDHIITPFLLLCLIGFIAFFSSYLRMPVLPLYATRLGADPTQVGSINGAFMLTAGLLSIPAGLLADRTGRKPSIIGGILAVALSSLLIPLCHSSAQMAMVYVIFGAGLAAFAPGMLSQVADVMPVNMLGQAYGWYTTAIYIAMTLGPVTGGYLAKHLGLPEVFLVSGFMSLAVALLAQLILPRGAPRHKTELHSVLTSSANLLHNRWLRACLLATLGSCIGFGVFLTFLPLYATFRGHDPAQVGLIFAAQALTNVACRVPIGRIADRTDRRWIVVSGMLFFALALTALGQLHQLSNLVLCAILLGIGMALTYTAIGAIIAEQVPALQRGLAMGLYNSCIYLGMMTGSTAFGIALKSMGYQFGFAAAGGVALLGLAGFLLLSQSR